MLTLVLYDVSFFAHCFLISSKDIELDIPMLCSKSFVYTVSVKKQQSMQRPLFDIIYHECHSF